MTGEVGEAQIGYRCQRGPLRWARVGASPPARRVVDVDVCGRDVEVADDQGGRLRSPGEHQLGPQALEPDQLVQVVRVVQLSAVRCVDRPDTQTGTIGGDHPGLVERVALGSREAPCNGGQAHSRRDRDPVPVVQAVMGDLVAGTLEGRVGELAVGALGLLQAADGGLMLTEPTRHLIDAGPDRVDVPADDLHGVKLGRRRRETQPPPPAPAAGPPGSPRSTGSFLPTAH